MAASTTHAELIQMMKTGNLYRYEYEGNLVEKVPLQIMNSTKLTTNAQTHTTTFTVPAAGSVVGVIADLDGCGIPIAGDECSITVDLQKDNGTSQATVLSATGVVSYNFNSPGYKPLADAALSFGTDGEDETGVTAAVLKTDGSEDFNAGDTLVLTAVTAVTQATFTTQKPHGLRVYVLVQYSA